MCLSSITKPPSNVGLIGVGGGRKGERRRWVKMKRRRVGRKGKGSKDEEEE